MPLIKSKYKFWKKLSNPFDQNRLKGVCVTNACADGYG